MDPAPEQFYRRTIANLNAELSQLRTELETARFRVSELEEQVSGLEKVRDSKRQFLNSLRTRLKSLVMSSPARNVSAPTAETLRNKLKSEKDPRERFLIQKRMDALSM